MRRYVLAFHGDNDRLHEEALRAAIAAAEKVNKAPVYRAWIENPRPWIESAPSSTDVSGDPS